MTTYLLPVAATILAAALVAVCCVRPMLRHRRHATCDLDAQIAAARAERARLRAATHDGELTPE